MKNGRFSSTSIFYYFRKKNYYGMKINHKIKIDLLKVFKTGKFDFIKIGHTKEWILNNFPEPDDYYGTGTTLESSEYWRYGNIEFQFSQDELTQISTQYIDSLDAGHNFLIEKWILEHPDKLSVQFVIQSLLDQRIGFQVKHSSGEYLCQTSIGIMDSGIHLNFQPKDIEPEESFKLISPNQYMLSAISIVDIEVIKTTYNRK